MTLFKCQMYLARTALIGDTFQIELEFRNCEKCKETVRVYQYFILSSATLEK